MKISTILSALIVLGTANPVRAVLYQDCGKSTPWRSNAKNIVLNIEGCPDSAPVCIFQLGQKASLEVSFKTISTFTSTHLTMSGRYGPARVPIPLIPTEACDTWGLKCPSEAGTQQTLKIEVPIPRKGWLRGRFEFQMKLYDGKRALLLCKTFPVEI
ncbi:hypothetical protein E4U59_007018 [Claviceps monticola]|nr:hypothetical protein E4U59_007018 [Claviceps monticola]